MKVKHCEKCEGEGILYFDYDTNDFVARPKYYLAGSCVVECSTCRGTGHIVEDDEHLDKQWKGVLDDLKECIDAQKDGGSR